MKKLSIFLLFLLFPFLSHADRLTLPSGSKQWSVWRDTYFNPMFEELYESLGANESGILPDTITLDGLIISGTGDSWLEMNNNTTFSDSLTGKYGLRFYNGVLQQIINGTASAIGSGGAAPTIQADDPTISDSTGWYLATTSGDAFYVVNGVGLFTIPGTYSGDETDPVVGTVTPDPATHDGTGTAIEITVASITEANEASRQYRIYDVTDAAVEEAYQSFTGLTINETLPADQHTYRLDILVTDLAGNTGTASSANIEYSSGVVSCSETPTFAFTSLDSYAYIGTDHYTNANVGIMWEGSTLSVCSVDFYLHPVGTLTGISYTAKIYTNNSGNLGTLIATSETVSGSAITTGWNNFVFDSEYELAANSFVVVSRTDPANESTSNYVEMNYTFGTSASTNFVSANNSGTVVSNVNRASAVRLYEAE